MAALDSPDADPAAEARLYLWLFATNRALEGKAHAVQWAIVAVFLDWVLRARLTDPEVDDCDGLDSAAEGLTAALDALLQRVGRGRSRPRRTTSCERECPASRLLGEE